jgi:hypothetical protein
MDAVSFVITDISNSFFTIGNHGDTYPGVVHPKLNWSAIKNINL